MSPAEYEDFCLRRLAPGNHNEQIFHCIFGILSESAELEEAEEVSHLLEEAGDILFYLTCLQALLGYDLLNPKMCTFADVLDHCKKVFFYKTSEWDIGIISGFHLINLATLAERFSIEELRNENVKKLKARYSDGFSKEESMARKDKEADHSS